MILYGKFDKYYGNATDVKDLAYVNLDFNRAVPLLSQGATKCLSICEDSFEKLFAILKKKITKRDHTRDLLILMRVKNAPVKSTKQIEQMGHRIANLMEDDSLVVWSAYRYHTYRFDFYFYKKPKKVTPQEVSKMFRFSKALKAEIHRKNKSEIRKTESVW